MLLKRQYPPETNGCFIYKDRGAIVPSKGEKIVDIECIYQRETDLAWLVTPSGKSRGIWVAKSKAEMDPPEASLGKTVTITTEPGFAELIGLA